MKEVDNKTEEVAYSIPTPDWSVHHNVRRYSQYLFFNTTSSFAED
jgi:hypothetical protein